jgi:signal transduction histidine kinase
VDASREGGTVVLEATDIGDQTRVTVTDEGAGIAPEHVESIFNPFFTTKSNGTGLGLALVSKIVDDHQGKICVRSDLGKGATFEMTLPHWLPT